MAIDPTSPPGVAPASPGANWKTRAYLIGIILGLGLGLLSAYLFVRAAEENSSGKTPQKIGTGDAMKLTLSLLNLIRQIAELGAKG